MCQNVSEKIYAAIESYAELKKMQEDLELEMDALKQTIIDFLDAEEDDTIMVDDYVVTYKEVVSQRCDTKALKQLLGDALEPYMKRIVSKRFVLR